MLCERCENLGRASGVVTQAAGLRVVDKRSWKLEPIQRDASAATMAGGTLLASAGGYPALRGIGLRGYGLDGSERFHLFGARTVSVLARLDDRVFVDDGGATYAVDARAGRVLRVMRRVPELLVGSMAALPTTAAEPRGGARCRSGNPAEGGHMKRFVILALTTLAAVALPSVAGAKEISKVELCGDDSCQTLTGKDAQGLVAGGEDMSQPPSAPGPYYRVTLTAEADGHSESWSIFYVPSDHRLALPDGNWQQLSGTLRAAYDRATADLEPYPTPVPERVIVDGLGVKDPASYTTLFAAGTSEGAVPSSLADWVPIELRFPGQTPWSSEKPYLFYSPADGLLQRGIELVKLPDDMVASIRARESLGSPDGFPWALAAAIALALAVLASALVWLAVRREWRPGIRRAPVPTA